MIDTHVKIERSSQKMQDRTSNGSPFKIKPESTTIETNSDVLQGRHISLSNLLNEFKQPKIVLKQKEEQQKQYLQSEFLNSDLYKSY